MSNIVLEHEEIHYQEPDHFEPDFDSSDDDGFFGKFLRIAGALAIVASLSMFTLDGWHEGNDTSRFLSLLSQTVILALGGWSIHRWLQEPKSARMLFILALGSVTANLTILGAMLYSVWPIDNGLIDYPSAMQWQAISLGQISLLGLGALALLAPLSYFGFSILTRAISVQMTQHFLILSALLLIPLRLPMYSAALSMLALLWAIRAIHELKDDPDVPPTLESKIAFGMLCLPGLIIACRSILLYPIDEVAVSLFATTAYLAIRYWRTILKHNVVLEAAAFITIGFVSLPLLDIFRSDVLGIAACLTVFLTFTFDHLRLSRESGRLAFWLNTANILLVMFVSLVSALSNDLAISGIGIAAIIGILLINKYVSEDNRSYAGNIISWICLPLLCLNFVVEMVAWVQLSNWLVLGAAGLVAIVSAALIEKKRR